MRNDEVHASERPIALSVIIPCYDCADGITEQLEGLAEQTWEGEWEVVIADNGGSDGLCEALAAYRSRLPRLRVVDASSVRGAAHARNVGARCAQGEMLVFTDADDVAAPGFVAGMADALEQHDFVAGRLEYDRLNAPAVRASRGHGQTEGVRPHDDPPYLPHASANALGVRRSAHELIGGFDESLPQLQDTDYCWRLQLAGIPLHFAPDAVLHYRLRDDPRAMMRQARRYGRYHVLLYKRYRKQGMPSASPRRAAKRWFGLVRSFPAFVRRPDYRLRWLRRAARSYGRLEGCILFRVFAP